MSPSKPRPQARRKLPTEDDREVLVRAILKLPTRLRDVFLLHRMAGMTYSEIGLHLGMIPKAVETSLTAALVRLMRAVPTSDPSSENQTASDAHPGQPKPKADHAAATRLERNADYENSGEKSRRIKSYQTPSKVGEPHAVERKVHNLGRPVRGPNTPEQS